MLRMLHISQLGNQKHSKGILIHVYKCIYWGCKHRVNELEANTFTLKIIECFSISYILRFGKCSYTVTFRFIQNLRQQKYFRLLCILACLIRLFLISSVIETF